MKVSTTKQILEPINAHRELLEAISPFLPVLRRISGAPNGAPQKRKPYDRLVAAIIESEKWFD